MPYSSRAIYKHHRQKNPTLFIRSTFRTIPLNQTNYRGKRFAGYMYSGTNAKAVVGKLILSCKSTIV